MTETDTEVIERRAIHAYLSPEAHEQFHSLTEEIGVSAAGLLEAMFRGMDSPDVEFSVGALDRPSLIKNARKVDAARRRRGGSR